LPLLFRVGRRDEITVRACLLSADCAEKLFEPNPEVKDIADRIVSRYRATILMALVATAESEGLPDLSALITDRSVDVFLRHAGDSLYLAT
jgi:hypothetical protein